MSSKAGPPPSPRYTSLLCEFMAYVHQKAKPYPKDHEVSGIFNYCIILLFINYICRVFDFVHKMCQLTSSCVTAIFSSRIFTFYIIILLSSLKMNLT